MGFYLELVRVPNKLEYRESQIPVVYWALYGIAGFALLCMGLSSHTLIIQLLKRDFWLDSLLGGAFLTVLPLYLFFGLKLAAIRKYIKFGDDLEIGFRCFGYPIRRRNLRRSQILSFDLTRHRSSPNVGKFQHQDSQYHNRGHWRLLARMNSEKTVVLDRHTDGELLRPIYEDLREWLTQR